MEHPVSSLLKQRIYGLALGYEDLNDHDELRHDPLLAVLCERSDPEGKHRSRERDRGKALAGKSTLNRLELTPSDATAQSRYQKIVANHAAIDALLVDLFLESRRKAPKRLILDVDATDDKLHGTQEGRHFNKYDYLLRCNSGTQTIILRRIECSSGIQYTNASFRKKNTSVAIT